MAKKIYLLQYLTKKNRYYLEEATIDDEGDGCFILDHQWEPHVKKLDEKKWVETQDFKTKKPSGEKTYALTLNEAIELYREHKSHGKRVDAICILKL